MSCVPRLLRLATSVFPRLQYPTRIPTSFQATSRYISTTSIFRMPDQLKASEVNSKTDPSVSKQYDNETPKDQQIEEFYKMVDSKKICMLNTYRDGVGMTFLLQFLLSQILMYMLPQVPLDALWLSRAATALTFSSSATRTRPNSPTYPKTKKFKSHFRTFEPKIGPPSPEPLQKPTTTIPVSRKCGVEAPQRGLATLATASTLEDLRTRV